LTRQSMQGEPIPTISMKATPEWDEVQRGV
jgi:hypothetical protein